MNSINIILDIEIDSEQFFSQLKLIVDRKLFAKLADLTQLWLTHTYSDRERYRDENEMILFIKSMLIDTHLLIELSRLFFTFLPSIFEFSHNILEIIRQIVISIDHKISTRQMIRTDVLSIVINRSAQLIPLNLKRCRSLTPFIQ